LQNFYKALSSVDFLSLKRTEITLSEILDVEKGFRDAMDDDFNSAKAIALLFDLAHRIRDARQEQTHREEAALMLVKLGKVLGFFQNLQSRLQDNMHDLSKQLIDLILGYRKEARANKDWALSDRLRDDPWLWAL
jgi:cysteinyl-tRNA synthetase